MQTNTAFVFVKPNASGVEAVMRLVKSKLGTSAGDIIEEGRISTEMIEQQGIASKHYNCLAPRAVTRRPDEYVLPIEGQDAFREMFKLPWLEALKSGQVFNAADAATRLEISTDELGRRCEQLQVGKDMLKLGRGFYCCKIDAIFVVNGFYTSMTQKLTVPDGHIAHFSVRWDSTSMSWTDFRDKVIGATDPAAAESGSLRHEFHRDWGQLGLPEAPTVHDNVLHASASAFEAMAERALWLNRPMAEDDVGRALLTVGVPLRTLAAWCQNPTVTYQWKRHPLFDLFEGLDTSECVKLASQVLAENDVSLFDPQSP